jgi:hypothetical protein
LLKQIQEVFTQAEGHFTEAQLHIVPRPFTLRCAPAVFHPSTRRRCERTAVDRFTQASAIRHLECVRTGRLGFVSLRSIVIGRRLRARGHSLRQPSDNLIKVIVSRDLRVTEINVPQASGISEIPESSSGMETISEMETTIFVVIGKDTFSRGIQGIGIGIGTITATIGGTVINAASLTDRG